MSTVNRSVPKTESPSPLMFIIVVLAIIAICIFGTVSFVVIRDSLRPNGQEVAAHGQATPAILLPAGSILDVVRAEARAENVEAATPVADQPSTLPEPPDPPITLVAEASPEVVESKPLPVPSAQPEVPEEPKPAITPPDEPEPAPSLPPGDYFHQLAAAYTHVYEGLAESERIEVQGPEGTFTIQVSKDGYYDTILTTPGGNTLQFHTSRQSEPAIYNVLASQGQTLFGINGWGYKSYDPTLDELQDAVVWKKRAWDPSHGFGRERTIYNPGYPAIKVGPYYLLFVDKRGAQKAGMLKTPWTHFHRIQSFDLKKREVVECHYQGLETGVLKDATLQGDKLLLRFGYNATRDLVVDFSPKTGFSEAKPVSLQQ